MSAKKTILLQSTQIIQADWVSLAEYRYTIDSHVHVRVDVVVTCTCTCMCRCWLHVHVCVDVVVTCTFVDVVILYI